MVISDSGRDSQPPPRVPRTTLGLVAAIATSGTSNPNRAKQKHLKVCIMITRAYPGKFSRILRKRYFRRKGRFFLLDIEVKLPKSGT
jgi:hypothetical protein